MFSKNKAKPHDPAATPEAAPAAVETAPEAVAPEAPEQPATPAPEAAVQPSAEASAPAEAAKPTGPSPEAAELAALKDRYVHLMADFDNFRKRQNREREELVKRANEALLGDLLPVVDHLELALKKATDKNDPVVTGVKMVYDQFLALFQRYDMTPIDAKGQPFDPAFHEALSQMSSATVPAQVVIDQFRRGWMLAGRLLRPSQVIVSSGAPDTGQAESENQSVTD